MTKKTHIKLVFPILAIFAFVFNMGCKQKPNTNESNSSFEKNIHKDTLKVVTLYGPTSYFDYRGEPMGIDYENAKRFANDEGMVLDIRILDNIQQLISSLKNGEAHLAAYPIPLIAEYKDQVLHCGNREISNQVLVQRNGETKVTDVTELIGKDIYVEKDSKYQYRIENLNEELGGGINIKIINNDTVVAEDFLRMVNDGKIDFSVIDSETASLYQSAFPKLDTSLKLSSDQAASWAVALGLDSLALKINNWENRTHTSQLVKEIYKRYYDNAFSDTFDANLSYFKKRNLSKGAAISDYDSYFKKYAEIAGVDWKLLAAIAYCESRYNTSIVSPFGASGLMQVMPASAKAMGVDPGALSSPDSNVLAAAKIIRKLNQSFQDKVIDPEERLKFVVAAYNSGLGHIYDAIALAEKLGLDKEKWNGSVAVTALMKSRPEYYNDPVVKCGYFRGRETVNFVDHVTSIYRYLKENIKA